MKSRFSIGLGVVLIASLFMGFVALPNQHKTFLPDYSFLNFLKSEVTLGLDLQGGTQLDYRIDLSSLEEKNANITEGHSDLQINDIIEGVRATLERRVNGLGVSEPQIYPSIIGDEYHMIVELAGIKDIEEAKKTVGKTIQLEFKERRTEIDPNEKVKKEQKANEILKEALTDGAVFSEVGKRNLTSDKKVDFREKAEFVSVLPNRYLELFKTLEVGSTHTEVIEASDGFVLGENGSLTEKTGLYIVNLKLKESRDNTKRLVSTFEEVAENLGVSIEKMAEVKEEDVPKFLEGQVTALRNKERNVGEIVEVDGQIRAYRLVAEKANDRVRASHILIAYEGSASASEDTTRTKEEARAEAERILEEAQKDPSKFAELAKKYSDGPSAERGGDLDFFARGAMVPPFEQAAFATQTGELAPITETNFGYHVIQVTDRESGEPTLDFEYIVLEDTPENREKMKAELERAEGYEVTEPEEWYEYDEIFIDLTPDPWKPTGLDGSMFERASVAYDSLNRPLVSIQFNAEGAAKFAEITERLVGQPLAIFVGGELVSSPNVSEKITGGSAVINGGLTGFALQEAADMAKDLNTGAIDAPIILSGQSTISASLGKNALNVSLWAGLIGLIILAAYMLLYYRLLGLFAVIALAIYSIIIVFVIKITGIVMTLAGIAGIILSIGMAVDANILIFERTLEELKSGKEFNQSIKVGFQRAWSSIRDSNVSSLITCVILWGFGNSIIRGFALMLGLGIMISMFTAITVTRQFLQTIQGTFLSRSRFLLGAGKFDSK